MTETFLEILALLSKNNKKIRQKTVRPGKIQSVLWRFLSLTAGISKKFAVILYPIFIHTSRGKYMFLYVQYSCGSSVQI